MFFLRWQCDSHPQQCENWIWHHHKQCGWAQKAASTDHRLSYHHHCAGSNSAWLFGELFSLMVPSNACIRWHVGRYCTLLGQLQHTALAVWYGSLTSCASSQPLILSYSGTSNFNPAISGQGASPTGPTLVVVSMSYLRANRPMFVCDVWNHRSPHSPAEQIVPYLLNIAKKLLVLGLRAIHGSQPANVEVIASAIPATPLAGALTTITGTLTNLSGSTPPTGVVTLAVLPGPSPCQPYPLRDQWQQAFMQ